MKLHLNHSDDIHLVRSGSAARVVIGGDVFTNSLIIAPDRIVPDWPVRAPDELTEERFRELAELAPEIVILGTGARLRFPEPASCAALANAQIGLEVMDTAAACRTYNILAADGRQVVGALVIGPSS